MLTLQALHGQEKDPVVNDRDDIQPFF